MTSDSGRTVSVWMASAEVPGQEPLTRDTTADVCVVGAGMAGMSTAYALAREGKSVVVLDDGPISGGETCRTTAHLSSYIDDGLGRVEKMHGTEGMRLAVQSHAAAIDRIESNVRDETINCDFQHLSGYLFISPNGQGMDYLNQEIDAAHRIGWKDAHWVDRAPLPFDTGRCLSFPRQAQFHPLKYLRGLTGAFIRRGGRVFSRSHAEQVEGGPQARVETSDGKKVTANAVVVATNSPIVDRYAIHTKQVAWRTYAIGLRVPKDAINRGLYWDTEEIYHYVRLQPIPGSGSDDYEVLIVGGEDHKTGQANDPDRRYARLEAWTRARFPMAGEMEFHWSGQVMEPVDYLGFIGRDPANDPNIYIATGDSGMGMTHGHIASILITDQIMGRTNPWEKLYDPSRKPLRAAPQYVADNLDIASQYRDYLTKGEISYPEQVPPRQGAVMRRGMSKVTVYRDENDQVVMHSAICPHLGCVVRWNYAEGTWDCPCHGSRFDPQGRVVNGPAVSALKPVE